jgi:hypothetical protein
MPEASQFYYTKYSDGCSLNFEECGKSELHCPVTRIPFPPINIPGRKGRPSGCVKNTAILKAFEIMKVYHTVWKTLSQLTK